MYRILLARSGYYYVQCNLSYNWKRIGGFFSTRASARRFIDDFRGTSPKVVEYY